jgi:hypothetical protein
MQQPVVAEFTRCLAKQSGDGCILVGKRRPLGSNFRLPLDIPSLTTTYGDYLVVWMLDISQIIAWTLK